MAHKSTSAEEMETRRVVEQHGVNVRSISVGVRNVDVDKRVPMGRRSPAVHRRNAGVDIYDWDPEPLPSAGIQTQLPYVRLAFD